MARNGLIGGLALVLAIIGAYIPTFGLYRIWAGLWESIFLLDILWLGYLFLTIGVLAVLCLLLTKKEKNPNRFMFLMFLALFCIMLGLQVSIPSWYSATWF